MKYYVLYNPYAGNGRSYHQTQKIRSHISGDIEITDLTKINDYQAFFDSLASEDIAILSGGDGTLNRFANDIEGATIHNDIYYYATGSGNDFLRDLNKKKGCAPFCINDYLRNLPIAEINGKRMRFINNVSFGIDGYCCEEADKIRANSDKRVNYTLIALKGLLYDYHPVNATVTVDGVTHEFQRVWFAPTMNGRFFGGGMMSAPGQDRLNAEGTESVIVLHDCSRWKILSVFPRVFRGTHIKLTDMITVLTGHEIEVTFDRPNAMQVDGETILNITKYKTFSRQWVKTHPDELGLK